MTSLLQRVAREEGGFTLVELLVAITLFALLLGAVLGTFNQFEVTSRLANDRNDSQARARQQLDQLARELRNLASPTPEHPEAVDKAEPYDMVFQTVDPTPPAGGSANTANVRRVRYCLNDSDPANAVLWVQWQTWTFADAPLMPSTASCPDGAWGPTNRRQVTANVTNRINGQNRPLFAFNSTTHADINRIHVDLHIDLTPAGNPTETHLATGVFLRNQNRKPTASFEWRPNGAPGSGSVLLNGSASEDPEGDPLAYEWYDVTGGAAVGPATHIGKDITCDCEALAAGTRSILLRVSDPPGLEADFTQTVILP